MVTLPLFIALALMLVGLIGSVLPGLPGPPLIWLATALYGYMAGWERVWPAHLVLSALVVAVAGFLEYSAGQKGAAPAGTRPGQPGAVAQAGTRPGQPGAVAPAGTRPGQPGAVAPAGTRPGQLGAVVGGILGLVLLGPLGLVLGAFAGAIAFELVVRQRWRPALRSGMATLLVPLGPRRLILLISLLLVVAFLFKVLGGGF